MEFSRGGDGDHHILIDFGEECAPLFPTQGQGIYRLKFAYLECVGSWTETDGQTKGLLIRDFINFWCMYYRSVPGTDGEMLQVYLSLRGRCSGDMLKHKEKNNPGEYASFATLVNYVPSDDERCTNDTYIKECRHHQDKCFQNNDCPSICHRCNVEKTGTKGCQFHTQEGRWTGSLEAVLRNSDRDTKEDLIIYVDRYGLQINNLGGFTCWDETDGPSSQNREVFSVVQSNPQSTFKELFACVRLSIPSEGVLNFMLQQAEHDLSTGKPIPCKQDIVGPKLMVPRDELPLITLLNKRKLLTRRVGCDITHHMLFPSYLSRCKLSLRQCSGSCTNLYADYDAASCGNDTSTRFNIEHEHICHAQLKLNDDARAILTSSVKSGRIRCWMFLDEELYVVAPEKCNPLGGESVSNMNGPGDETALQYFDPFIGITPTYDSNGDSTLSVKARKEIVFMFLSMMFLKVFVWN